MHLPELDFAPGVAAALTDTTREQAEELLEALVDTHLVEAAPAPGRYRFHDLLRLYARERVQTDETDLDRDAAQRRMLTWYLDNVTAAVQVLTPGRRDLLRERAGDWPEPVSSTPAQAVAWFEAEWANLVAATHQTAACGLHEIAWQIPDALYSFASLRRQWMDWRNACLVGRAAAQQACDPQAEAWMLTGMGVVCRRLRRFEGAIHCLQQALAMHRDMGDRRGMAWEWGYLGLAHRDLRRFGEAIGCLQQAVAIHREVRDRYTEGWTLDYFGLALQRARGMDAARACWQEALTIFTELGVLEANEVRIRLEGDALHYGRQRFIAVGAVEATSLNRWSLLVGGRTYPRQPVP